MHTHRHIQTSGSTIHWAGRYDAVVRLLSLGRDRALRRRTLELAGLRPGEIVLDVGCGTGDLTLLARERVGEQGRVYGIDASPQMIERARQKARSRALELELLVEPIERLSFATDSFDLVLSSLMMHHLPDELKRRGLAEIYRVLKPGGRLLIVDFKRPSGPLGRALLHLSLHSRMRAGVQDLPALLEQAGFAQLESGSAGWRTLGFARGTKR